MLKLSSMVALSSKIATLLPLLDKPSGLSTWARTILLLLRRLQSTSPEDLYVLIAHFKKLSTWGRPDFMRIARAAFDRMSAQRKVPDMKTFNSVFQGAILEMARAVNPVAFTIEAGFDANTGSLRQVYMDLHTSSTRAPRSSTASTPSAGSRPAPPTLPTMTTCGGCWTWSA